MQTKRDYLVSLGLAKEGRGKFSNAAKEALSKAEAGGMKFSDSATAPVKGVKSEPTAPVAKPATDTAWKSPSEYRYPEGRYKAVGSNGKVYGMREACNTCKVSLVDHMCNNPTISTASSPVAVTIVDKGKG